MSSYDLVRVVATIKAKPDQIEACKAILQELIPPTLAEEGCLQYELLLNQNDETEFIFLETWTSSETLTKHLATEHLQKAVRDIEDKLARTLRYTPLH